MDNIIAFWFVSMLFVMTPGADWAYAISSGLKNAVVSAVSGLLLGHIAALLVVATGLGVIIHKNPHLLLLISTIGAVYLLWIGIKIFKNPATISSDQENDSANAQDSYTHKDWLVKGLCISGLNPKVFLLFFMMLPQFISTNAATAVNAQIFTLGTIHMINCSIIYFIVGFASKALLQSRPQAAIWVSRISGGLVIAISLILISEQLMIVQDQWIKVI